MHSCQTEDKFVGQGMLTEAAGSAQTTKSTLYKKPFLSSTALNQARGNTEKEQHNPHSENGTGYNILAKYTSQRN